MQLCPQESFPPLSPAKAVLTLATAKSRRRGDDITSCEPPFSSAALFCVSRRQAASSPCCFPLMFPFSSDVSGITVCSLLLHDLPLKLRILVRCKNPTWKIIFKTHPEERMWKRAPGHLWGYRLHPLSWGNKGSAPALPQHQQPSINRPAKKRTDVTKIIPGSAADHSQSRRV